MELSAMAFAPEDERLEDDQRSQHDTQQEKASRRTNIEDGPVPVPLESEAPVAVANDQSVDETAEPQSQGIEPRLKSTTLLDRALYRGHVDDDSQPHGLGLVYPALGTHIYGGEFQNGRKAGLGVQLLPNGTLYAGEFDDEYPSGYGVKRDPFGSQFIGEWSEGELHGLGLSVRVDGAVTWGRFLLNELDDHADATNISWPQAQEAVLRAMLAEQNGIQAHERARQVELQVALHGLTTIDASYLRTEDEIAEFTAQEERELKAFLTTTQLEYNAVEAEGDRWKFQEAQLKERQKNLRREITDKRTELSFLAKYVGIAEERQAQVADAERTLQALHRQIELLQAQVLKALEDSMPDPTTMNNDEGHSFIKETPRSEREHAQNDEVGDAKEE